MGGPYRNVEKCTFEVNDAEVLGPMDLVGEVAEEWEWVTVSHSLGIQSPKIRARPD